jgi:uncharacterized membrane protein YeaQ/YmgE (transglycosylase-associated protein family)
MQPGCTERRRWVVGSIFWWIVVGALAGILAKAIMPGDKAEPKGCLMTILLGIAGSVAAGFIMRNLLGMTGRGGFVPTIVGATLGAILLIFLLRKFWKNA